MTRKTAPTLLSLLVAFSVVGVGLPDDLRAEPSVELLTIGPGDALFTRFGHTALRVVDPEAGIDRVYNYGTAPFGRPDFMWGFLRGQARFYLAVGPTLLTYVGYSAENRTIERQHLNLTPTQVEEIVAFLEWNAEPENREYIYDHHMDNCSTRVRDLLDDVTDGALRRAVQNWPVRWTYRQLTLHAMAGRTDYLIALDVISGPNQATLADGWALLYLPAFLRDAVAEAVVDEPHGIPLADPAETLYERRGPPAIRGNPYAARILVVLVGVAMCLWLLLLGWLTRETSGGALRLAVRVTGLVVMAIGLVFGLLGTVFFVLGLVSTVPDTHWNENVWVFLPFDLWWVGTGLRWSFRGWPTLSRPLRVYLGLRLAELVGYALFKLLGVFPQDNWSFLIVVGLVCLGMRLGMRSVLDAPEAAPALPEPGRGAVQEDSHPPPESE